MVQINLPKLWPSKGASSSADVAAILSFDDFRCNMKDWQDRVPVMKQANIKSLYVIMCKYM